MPPGVLPHELAGRTDARLGRAQRANVERLAEASGLGVGDLARGSGYIHRLPYHRPAADHQRGAFLFSSTLDLLPQVFVADQLARSGNVHLGTPVTLVVTK